LWRVAAGAPPEEAVRPPADKGAVADDRGDGGGTDGEVGEVRLDVLAREAGRVQESQRFLDQRAPVLPGGDEGAANLAGLDHCAGDGQRVEEAEAGVGKVEDLRGVGQPDEAMGEGGGRGLQHIPADSGVDEQFDLGAGDPGTGQGGAAGDGTGCRGAGARRPHPPRTDARHQFQPSRRQPQPRV